MDKEILKQVGSEFKKKRQAAKLKIGDVSKQLRIKKSYLQGIEKGDVTQVPSEAYVLGYIRHYAKLLGLRPDDYIERLRSSEQIIQAVGSKDLITDKEFLPTKKIIILSLGLLVALYIIATLV
ncbi:MAG: helix-turn-helix domain-containing protein [Rickettsiales bacterium]